MFETLSTIITGMKIGQNITYNTISTLVQDQINKNNISCAEQILVSAHECELLYKDDLNKISKDNGLTLFWTEDL